jgi:GTP-binding protein HflX
MSTSIRKVVLVTYPDDFTQEEAKGLVNSADRKILRVFTQKYLNRSKYGMGAGKAEEISEFVKESGAEQVIVDEHLTSRQMYNLEKLVGVQAIDRERLILDIFRSRATTTEAKLQIELAEIKYEIPRVREGAKLTTGSERPGKGGSGEYVVDVKFRELKRRMSFIYEKLDDARKKRELYHHQREKDHLPVVSLVGYTSSGKTTLFNLLTEEHKITSSHLFTTLSTATRAFPLGGITTSASATATNNVLLTDTVGFISRLPTYMIDAFKSTLEESLTANVVLLLIDASEDMQSIRIKYMTCMQILEELKVDKSKILLIFTKYDKVGSEDAISQIADSLGVHERIAISAKTGYGMHKMKSSIGQRLNEMRTPQPQPPSSSTTTTGRSATTSHGQDK